MATLAAGGFTHDEVLEMLESASVQLSVRVEVQTKAGVPVMDLRNVVGGKVTHDATRNIRKTLQVLRIEPAGVGDDFDNSDTLKNFTKYGTVDVAIRPQNNGEIDLSNLPTFAALFVYNGFVYDDVEVDCDFNRMDVGGVVARFVDKNNYYIIQCMDASSSQTGLENTVTIYRKRGNAPFSLGYTNIASVKVVLTRGKPLNLRLRVTGTNPVKLEVFLNDALILTGFDSDGIKIAGRCGLWSNGGKQTYQRWGARPFDSVDYLQQRFAVFAQIRMPVLLARTENTAAQFNAGTRSNTVVSGQTVVLSGANLTGTYTSPAIALSGIGIAKRTQISWQAAVPANTAIVVETSIDNGLTWDKAINNSVISAIPPGFALAGRTLLVRVTMTRASSVPVIALQSLTIRVLSNNNMGDFVEIPLGRFIMPTPKITSDDGTTVKMKIEGYDTSYVLVDELGVRLSYLINTKVTDAIKDLFTRANIRAYNIQDLPTLFVTTREFEPRKTYFDALKELCEYASLDWFVDENDVFNVFRWIDPQQRSVKWEYRTNSKSLVRPVSSKTLDTFDVPNKVYLVVSETDRETVLTATVINSDPESPISTVSRGYTKTFSDYQADAPDEATLYLQAKQVLFKKSQVLEAVGFGSIFNPGHGHEDMIMIIHDVLGLRAIYVEKAWELSFSVADDMAHDIERLILVSFTIG